MKIDWPTEQQKQNAVYIKELKKKNKDLKDLLFEYFQWSSASQDFQEGGIARKGFLKYKKIIDNIR